MWEQLLPGLRIKLFMTVVLGILYPLAMTGVGQALFPRNASGNLVRQGDKVIGSDIIGQNFTKPEYFHPRPSSAGSGYDAASSGGSNLGPTSAKLFLGTTKSDDKKKEVVDFDGVSLRVLHYCLENDLPFNTTIPIDRFKNTAGELDDVLLIKAFNNDKSRLVITSRSPIPADAVTGSASGLDPHISVANADLQLARVAKSRGVARVEIESLVAQIAERPDLGLLGEPRVNVLRLNLALDQRFALKH